MKTAKRERPNIVVALTDDQGAWAMGCAGNREIRTPNLDRLARTGLRFENCFCASPVCSPARASLLTGRIPSQHGVHDWLRGGNHKGDRGGNSRPIEYLRGQTAYTDLLAANGYVCGISGKWHLGDSARPQKSFSFWDVHAGGGGPYYNAPMVRSGRLYRDPRYVSDLITDNAIRFLEGRKGKRQPFYLSVHYTAPHSPWDRGNHPAALWDDYFRHCPFRSVPRLPMHPWQVNSAPYGTRTKRRGVLSGYFAAITAMDANVGRILDWLEENDLREDTLVFFTGDNGMNMGHHGVYGKGNGTFPLNMYDTSVKVPAIFSRPGHVPAGRVSRDLVSHYDILPTLTAYAGIRNPLAKELPGRSFAGRLRGGSAEGREAVVIADEYGPVRMIRTALWKYVHRYPYGPNELYDLRNDPGEDENRAGEPRMAARIREMKGEMESWFDRYVDPEIDGVREPVTGKGQVDWAGVLGNGARAYCDDFLYLRPGAGRRTSV
jgi:arylsulfatase A-like enzyme